MALVCLSMSRLVGVAPGVLYGLFTGLAVAGGIDRRTEGRAYARSSLLLVGLALVAFVVQRVVASAAAGTDPGFAILVFDTAVVVVFVGGLQAVIVQLMPTRGALGERREDRRLEPTCLVGAARRLGGALPPAGGATEPRTTALGSVWFIAALVLGAIGVLGLECDAGSTHGARG